MEISLELIKELRGITAASIANCKKALKESNGDIKKAVVFLRKHGLEIAANKGGRTAKEGRIEAYVHTGNKIGVLIEVNSETDFVARSAEFAQFTKDLAMQITASSPTYIKREDVPKDVIEHEHDKELFYKNNCLMEQPFVKDASITIKDYLGSIVAKFSENITVRRFIRYRLGE